MARKTATAATPAGKIDFLAALMAAGQDDLEVIDREIETHKRALDGLIAARKILSARLNGRPKGAGCPLSAADREQRLNAIFDFLQQQPGPATCKEIAEELGTAIGVGQLCKRSDWFTKIGSRYTIAKKMKLEPV